VNIQDGSVVHTDEGVPVVLERNVSVGHLVMLHGCTVRENSLIGIGAIILNRAVIGKNCLVGAGAMVTEGKEIPDGSLVLGGEQDRARAHARGDRDQHLDRATLRRARGALPQGPQAFRMSDGRGLRSDRRTAAIEGAGEIPRLARGLGAAHRLREPLSLPAAARALGRAGRRVFHAPEICDRLRHRAERARLRAARHAGVPVLPRDIALARAIAKTTALGLAFSFAMECAQLFIPTRIASVYDVAANTAGALAGALVFVDPWYSVVTRPLGGFRGRIVIEGGWGDAGLVLVMLWLIAQLNPALPFFGAGNILAEDDTSGAAATLQWVGVALSICGFGLFISSLLRGPQGALRITVVLLSMALWLKFVAASFMLQPHFAEDWLSVGRIVGLVAGIALLLPLRLLPRGARMYAAILSMLAGALFSKIFGAYSALDELLRVFRWPYGQLASFTTLTQYVHEAWPFLALVFLIALFLHTRKISA
jgi:hypothetical protein